jgi:hypothetical protein
MKSATVKEGQSPYVITEYSKQQAKKLGVELRQSSDPKKKVDIFKNGEKIVSVGATGYGDFPTFMKTMGKTYADERRRLYKIRHNKTRGIKNTPSWWADKILW